MSKRADGTMQIGELATEAGVSHRTIHYYERLGLVTPPDRERLGYRFYGEDAIQRLRLIERMKQLGLSLEEIGRVIHLYDDDPASLKGKEGVVAILEQHIKDADAKISELSALRARAQENVNRLRRLIAAGDAPEHG